MAIEAAVEKPKESITPVPMSDELRAQIYHSARIDRRGLTAQIVVLLEEALAARAKRK